MNSDESNSNKGKYIGHTTSRDLINWRSGSQSIFPYKTNCIYKGGIICDSNNITGFGTNENPPLVALIAVTDVENISSEGGMKTLPMLAYSIDEANSWTISTDKINFPEAFLKNPQNIQIIWHQPTRKWIMSLALSNHVEFYSSPDLRFWNFDSLFGIDFFDENIKWKRSALFPLGDDIHWALLIDVETADAGQSSGGTLYFVGTSDGLNFIKITSKPHWLDYGKNIYGSLVCLGTDERRINLVWRNMIGRQLLKNAFQETGIISIPRELSLDNIKGELAISISPVSEIREIYEKEIKLGPINVSSKVEDRPVFRLRTPFEAVLKFNTNEIIRWTFPTRFGVSFWNKFGEYLVFGYDTFGYYFLDKTGLKPTSEKQTVNCFIKMPFVHSDSIMILHFIVGISSIECYTESGKLVMTDTYSSKKQLNYMSPFAENGRLELLDGKIIKLGLR